MNKKLTYFVLSLCCLVTVYGFQHWKIYALDKTATELATNLGYDKDNRAEMNCTSPIIYSTKDIVSTQATIYWEDTVNTAWEYYVNPVGGPIPTGVGTPTTAKENTITQDSNGNPLQPNTEYEYWVRAVCGAKYGDWEGPIDFRTPCVAFVTPFSEGFNTNSTTIDCWTIVDVNNDARDDYMGGIGGYTNIWKENDHLGYNNDFDYEGDGSMIFENLSTNNRLEQQGIKGIKHDDWLISPPITMTGGIYAISYYYKTILDPFPNISYTINNEFEVLLSQNGVDLDQFTTVLVPKKNYILEPSLTYENVDDYKRKVVYVEGIVGDVHIGWHVTSINQTQIMLDWVTVEEVDCKGMEMDDIHLDVLTDLEPDQATISWDDDINTQWEYYVQPIGGGNPIGSGTLTSNKRVTVTRESGGGSLQPNGEYEFWVRSICENGTGNWVGPIVFTTPCATLPLPFWEGFNRTSSTLHCWTVVDNNLDMRVWNQWTQPSTVPFEGDGVMGFSGVPDIVDDDWLISPTFTLQATKLYRLKFHYRISYVKNDWEVLLSTEGIRPEKFTTMLFRKEKDITDNWKEEKIIMAGVDGDVHVAWHNFTRINPADNLSTPWPENYYELDNLFFEEIDCSEPMFLGAKDIYKDEVTVYWEDDFGSDWEYVLQKSGTGIPASGATSKGKEITLKQDTDAQLLTPNTEYEFYVRTNCGGGLYGEWSGPYTFRTLCDDVLSLPFWEGFNIDSESRFCWTVVDQNSDADRRVRPEYLHNRWANVLDGLSLSGRAVSVYEGSGCMGIQSGIYVEPSSFNDWLISPTFKFEKGKTYRLKYHYYLPQIESENTDFEVLISNQGIDIDKFNKTVVPVREYESYGIWKEEYTFISDISGEVNLAWHVTAPIAHSQYELYIDSVFIEEVEGCPEPLLTTLGAKSRHNSSAAIFWEDDTGATSWEYHVQEKGLGKPVGSGTVSMTKEVVVTQDHAGNTLDSTRDYEFYVRTVCGNGEYSIWTGPFSFTVCSVLDTPFWEGFNSDSKTHKCWVIDDSREFYEAVGHDIKDVQEQIGTANFSNPTFEGDGSEPLTNFSNIIYSWMEGSEKKESSLISPSIKLNGGTYVLKYHYIVPEAILLPVGTLLEVVISGIDDQGKLIEQTLIAEKPYAATSGWEEEVQFITGISGEVNIEWHVSSSDMLFGLYAFGLDNVFVTEVEHCPEPYYVKITGETSTSIDIEWEEYGNSGEWEVIVVEYGEDEGATPVQTLLVTGSSNATITGLDSGKVYTIYVRAKCAEEDSYSDWSTPVSGATKVGPSDDCSGAMKIPVNDSLECMETVEVFLLGATPSSSPTPDCAPNLKNDVWLEFTATSDSHLLEIDYFSPSTLVLEGALYETDCNSISSTPKECFQLGLTVPNKLSEMHLFENLTVGQRYYIRLGTENGITENRVEQFVFNLCLRNVGYLDVSPSGGQYTVEELVKEVFINSNCDLVSNIHYQNGDGSPDTQTVNTLGYFNRNGTDFPFEEGIVLSTGQVEFVPGPYNPRSFGSNPHRWTGDKDINDLINDAGRIPMLSGLLAVPRVTQLEFDFIPVKDSIHFEYLFASNSYSWFCALNCDNAALFGAWLIDTTTGEGQNLAKIKGTETPISTYTIWDSEKSGGSCTTYPELFWKSYYDNGAGSPDNPIEAPINYIGYTVAMSSKPVHVVPGRQYHIKLAVLDFCPNDAHTSAVFFNAGSFNLGDIDLGEDWLIETDNALCSGETRILNSNIVEYEGFEVEFEWKKDGVLIDGASSSELEVSEGGEYEVKVKFVDIDCERIDAIKVEMYPPISEDIRKPEKIVVCQSSLEDIELDLEQVEAGMFSQSGKGSYTTAYFGTEEEARLNENPLQNTIDYNLGKEPETHTIYIRVNSTETGCHEIFELHIQPQKGEAPEKTEDISVCAEYVFPELKNNQYYYSESGAGGVEYKAEEVLDIPGEHTIYVLQLNDEDGCYEETSYKVSITAAVIADVFEDVEIECELYELQPLSEYNRYFTEPNGGGIELYPGMEIPLAQTVYVFTESEDGLCTDESSFTVTYNDCPIPRGISPNGDGLNDTFDLSRHGVESIKIYNRWGTEVYSHGLGYTDQWYGQSKSGKQLPDGTYYYVIQAHGKTRTGWVQINR